MFRFLALYSLVPVGVITNLRNWFTKNKVQIVLAMRKTFRQVPVFRISNAFLTAVHSQERQ